MAGFIQDMTLTKTEENNRNIFKYGQASWSESKDSNYSDDLLVRMAIFLSESLIPFERVKRMSDDERNHYLKVSPQDIRDLL
jgi:hypothetical protein